MRIWKIAFSAFILGCSSSGTQASLDGSLDATNPGADATSDAEDDGGDAGDGGDAPFNPCYPVVAVSAKPSQDCVFAGACPADCLVGSASAYFCSTPGFVDASPLYPSVFSMPTGVIDVVGTKVATYPWDGAAWVSCAPLSCVRWSTGDHIGGSSAAASDPCADGGDNFEAWSCPPSPGVVPPIATCFSSGALGAIGGPDTGIPQQSVWCCPSLSDAGPEQDARSEAGGRDGGDAGEGAAGDGGTSDATLDGAATDAAPDAMAIDSGLD